MIYIYIYISFIHDDIIYDREGAGPGPGALA